MRKFLTLLRTEVLVAFEYRGDMAIFLVSGLSQPIVLLAIWLGVIASGGVTPMSRDGFIQYYLILFIVSLWTNAWGSVFIANKIRLGDLSPYLLHPVHYFTVLLTENLGEKILRSFLIIPVIIMVAFIFKPVLPGFDLVVTALFLMSLGLSFALVFFIDTTMGLLAFWLDDISSVENSFDIFLTLLSGRLIPLIALPKLVQEVGIFLPFRYSLSFPIEILLKQTFGPQILLGFAVQTSWVGIFAVLMFMLWHKGLKRYSAAGA